MHTSGPVLLYDGACVLCNKFATFVLKQSAKSPIVLTSLQSSEGTEYLKVFNLDAQKLNTLVFINDGNCYVKSSAVLILLGKLNGPIRMLRVFMVVPRPIRDFVYDLVARYRYYFFGRIEACPLPNKGR